jgi:hypothetical protein
LFKNLLPLASFGGVPYGVDEAGVVKCVVKPGCAVSALSQISYKMSVDLTQASIGQFSIPGNIGFPWFIPSLNTKKGSFGRSGTSAITLTFRGN